MANQKPDNTLINEAVQDSQSTVGGAMPENKVYNPGQGITQETLKKANGGLWQQMRDRLFGTYVYTRVEHWVANRYNREGHLIFDGKHIATVDNSNITFYKASDNEGAPLTANGIDKPDASSSIEGINLPDTSKTGKEWRNNLAHFKRNLWRRLEANGHTPETIKALLNEIELLYVPFQNKRVFSENRRQQVIEDSKAQKANPDILGSKDQEPSLRYYTTWKEPDNIVITATEKIQRFHDDFLSGGISWLHKHRESLDKVPVIGPLTNKLLDIFPFESKPPEGRRPRHTNRASEKRQHTTHKEIKVLRDFPNKENNHYAGYNKEAYIEYLSTHRKGELDLEDFVEQARKHRRAELAPKIGKGVLSKEEKAHDTIEHYAQSRGKQDYEDYKECFPLSFDSNADYVKYKVEKYTFNQTEGNARGFAEQFIRVSAGFAFMGSGTALSEWTFGTLGRVRDGFTRYFHPNKEKRQEARDKLKDDGGIPGLLKKEMLKAGGGSVRHLLRDHMADWHVGLFYIYAKEEFMRTNGPLDHPDKYAWVMRRAFTMYNMYVEVVHNTGYDFLEDSVLGKKEGKFNQYRERHKPSNYDELNVVQRGWNFVMDGFGFVFERGTQTFTHMQGATTFFGANRFHGLAKAQEIHTLSKHRIEGLSGGIREQAVFKFDQPDRGPYIHIPEGASPEETKIINQEYAQYFRARYLMNRAVRRYRMKQDEGEKWPVIEQLLNDTERREWNLNPDHMTDDGKRVKLGESGTVPIFPTGGWDTPGKRHPNGLTDLEITKKFKLAFGTESVIDRGVQDTFKHSSSIIANTLEKGNEMFPSGGDMLRRAMTLGNSKGKSETELNENTMRNAMEWQSAYNYAFYSGAKKVFDPLAQASETVGVVTSSGTNLLDKLKFGKDTYDERKTGEKKSIIRYVADIFTMPFRAVGNLVGMGKDKEAAGESESPLRSHSSNMQADVGDTKIARSAGQAFQDQIDAMDRRFESLEAHDREQMEHSSPEQLMQRMATIESRVGELNGRLQAIQNMALTEDVRETRTAIASELNALKNEHEQIGELFGADAAHIVQGPLTPQ